MKIGNKAVSFIICGLGSCSSSELMAGGPTQPSVGGWGDGKWILSLRSWRGGSVSAEVGKPYGQ